MNNNDFDTVSTPTDVLAESLNELDALCTEPTAQDPVVPMLGNDESSVDDSVNDSEKPVPVAEGDKLKKERKKRDGVGVAELRQKSLCDDIMNIFKNDPTPTGCSEMVRKLEAAGVTSPTLWTDTYAVLNGSGAFEPGPTLGKRVKFVLKSVTVSVETLAA